MNFFGKKFEMSNFVEVFKVVQKNLKEISNKLLYPKKFPMALPPYRLLKFVYSSIDFFSYFELATSKILLKSILKRKINPLITKNRFGTFQLSLGYLNNKNPQVHLYSEILIFHMFPRKFFFFSFVFFIVFSTQRQKTYFSWNSIFNLKSNLKSNVMQRNEENFTIDSRLKMSNDFQLTFPFSAVCQSAEIISHTHNLPPHLKPTLKFLGSCFSKQELKRCFHRIVWDANF